MMTKAVQAVADFEKAAVEFALAYGEGEAERLGRALEAARSKVLEMAVRPILVSNEGETRRRERDDIVRFLRARGFSNIADAVARGEHVNPG